MEAVEKSGAVDLCVIARDRFCETDKYVFQVSMIINIIMHLHVHPHHYHYGVTSGRNLF